MQTSTQATTRLTHPHLALLAKVSFGNFLHMFDSRQIRTFTLSVIILLYHVQTSLTNIPTRYERACTGVQFSFNCNYNFSFIFRFRFPIQNMLTYELIHSLTFRCVRCSSHECRCCCSRRQSLLNKLFSYSRNVAGWMTGGWGRCVVMLWHLLYSVLQR